MSLSQRPRVICHMLASIDGRIATSDWPLSGEGRRQYELVHASYEADGWICGRVTMEPFAKRMRSGSEVAREHTSGVPREDFVAPGDHESFAFAIDPSGRLAWESNDIDGDHVVAILSERVSDEYLTSLREQGVSYLIAGERDVDLSLALEKIGARFGVRTLMLEGGGRINGGMLRAGLIDEVSVASRQQSQGIEQVSQAIAQMEKVTQSTAATAEESAAASEELSAQADTALSIVGSLEEMVGAGTARPAVARRKPIGAVPMKNVVSLAARQSKLRPSARSAEEAIPLEGTGTFGSF